MVDGAQATAAEQIGELIRIQLVRLVPVLGFPPPVTDDDPIDHGREHVMQPLRLRSFFERDMNGAA
jgi:hypothetical protein